MDKSKWRRVLPAATTRYAAAAAAAVVAVILRLLLDPFVTGVQFITFFPAVMLVAYLFGSRPGLLTTLLCGIAGWYFVLKPINSFAMLSVAEGISLATFFVVGSVMAVSIGGLSAALKRERGYVEQQRLLVEELNHRVKNNLSVVQFIARQTMRPDVCRPDVRAEFEGRLVALASAHEVLTRRNWENVSLVDLLTNLLCSVGLDENRVALDGPQIVLQPKAAITLTLAVHELATNAIKYGALSVDSGHVDIRWHVDKDRLFVQWQEEGGPVVEEPKKRGFGTLMVERALAREFGGSAKIRFQPGGVICVIDAPMSDAAAVSLR